MFAEEGGESAGISDRRWIIDPLYGRVNYAAGFARFCVSIALEQHGKLEVGVVYDPVRDELFTTMRGLAATLNSTPLHVGTVESIQRVVISTGFSYEVWTTRRDNLAQVALFLKNACRSWQIACHPLVLL